MVVEPALGRVLVGRDLQRSADKYYPSVQGLRGLSALSVLFLHIHLMATNRGIFPTVPNFVELAWGTLGNGVALFFIISGFVIPASLVRHRDLKRFFVDRLLRIMPVFVVIHFLVFIVGPFIGYKWLRDVSASNYLALFFSNLTFTALPLGLPLAQQNSWTLTYEWGFYICFGAAWVAASSKRARLPIMVLIAIATAAICSVFTTCLFFLVGMAFARFRPTWRINRTIEMFLVPVCFVVFYYCAQYVGNLAAIPPAVVIFWAVMQDGSLTSRALETRPMQFLGKISYSLYLVHPVAIFPFVLLSGRLVRQGFDVNQVFPMFVVVSLVATFAWSILSYHLLEVRLRQVLANWVKPRQQTAGVPRSSGVAI